MTEAKASKNKYEIAYKAISSLHRMLQTLGQRTPRALVGLAGELLVKAKLDELGVPFEAKGGQARCDILLGDSLKGKRVEVRTSCLQLMKGGSEGHGWTIQRKGKRELAFDYLICVALDSQLGSPEFFTFTRDEALKAEDTESKRFPSLRKKLHMFQTPEGLKQALQVQPNSITEWERQVNHNKEIYRNRWQVLTT